MQIDYELALERVRSKLTEKQIQLLVELYLAPEGGVAASVLAPKLGYAHHGPVNSQIASIGKKLQGAVAASPPRRSNGSIRWWNVVAREGSSADGLFKWELHEPLRAALKKSGLVTEGDSLFPEVVDGQSARPFLEGAVTTILINAYERNPQARRNCIEHYGVTCFVCGFNFASRYGEIGEGVIHIHHLTPLSALGGKARGVDPVRDLRPVCANCHVIIHRRNPPFTIEEVRAFIAGASDSSIGTDRAHT